MIKQDTTTGKTLWKGKEMPLIPLRKPILDAKFFDELLKDKEKREEVEKKQKELEKELFAELIAEKIVERLKKEKQLGLWGR